MGFVQVENTILINTNFKRNYVYEQTLFYHNGSKDYGVHNLG